MFNEYIIPTVINEVDILKDNKLKIHNELKPQLWLENPKDLLSIKFLEILESFNIPCVVCIIFFKPKNYVETFAHIDYQTKTLIQTHAFNIITQGVDSTMSWYEKKLDNSSWDLPLTKQDVPHLSYKVESCNLKFSYKLPLHQLMLVNTSMLHVINVSQESRLCVSLRTGLVFPTWYSAAQHFSYLFDKS